MASEFIGYNVLVTLRAPPDATIQGVVANVIGQRLMLQNVTLSWSHQQLPTYSVEAPDIADLSLGPSNFAPQGVQPPEAARHLVQGGPPALVPAPAPAPAQQFQDPAILSFSKPPNQQTSQIGQFPRSQTLPDGFAQQQVQAAQLIESFSNVELSGDSKVQGSQEKDAQGITSNENLGVQQGAPPASKRGRRVAQKTENSVSFNKHDGATNTNPKTRGWRQTAFVEPSFQTTPRRGGESINGRRQKKKNRGGYAEDPSGWATEDATDIQEMGEFDFESNLSKFDKRRVFEAIRNDDTTADEARLVSFNRRVPKPGTNGGKNLHWTENVLDSPQSEDGESDQERSDAKMSGSNYSGRDLSRASARGQGVRKGSGILGQPLVLPQVNSIGRSQLNTSRTTSPRPTKNSVTASPITGPGVPGASLRLTTTNRSCPTVSPLQTIEVEQIAVAELGLTEDMITENAGRGIAEAAVGLLSNDAAAPTMLVLTGNHRTGARAIAAARHLRNRGHRVTVCMLGIEHETELLENCRKQLEVFKKIGGRVHRWEDLAVRLSASDFNPDLVVDALFGIHLAFDDLRTDNQATAFEMISWANRSNLGILSVDVPSGLSASSGEETAVDGGQLCVDATSVVCLGAPKTGILNALLTGEGQSWKLSVADIGIPQIVWRKYGTRRRHGIDFGNRWVVPLRYQPPSM